MATRMPNPVSKEIENIWNESHDSANCAEDSKGVMGSYAGIDRIPCNGDPSRCHIPGQNQHGESRRGEFLVRIDHIQVGTDEDGRDAKTENRGRNDRGPDANAGLDV